MHKILVIEDDSNLRLNTVDLLKEEGFEVIEAENGRVGIDLAKDSLPDLIISDIMMPEIDGYGVLSELQNDIITSAIPFIFLTAKTEFTDIRNGMNIGADDYITKPFRTQDLLNAVNARLKKKKQIDNKFNEMYERIAKYLPHELRTPLVAVLGFSEIIKDNIDELNKEEILDMVEKIHYGGNRLYKHIEKFLYFSELETFINDKEQISVIKNASTDSAGKVIYNEIIKTADKFGRRSDLMLDIQETVLKIFQTHLEVVISEIVENACKFSEKGTPITIYSSIEDEKYVLLITDNGKGMTNEQVKNIGVLKQFDRESFEQSGLGLGLSVVEKIMRLYYGAVSVKSKIGNYTIIQLEFRIHNNKNIK